ncbi:MAG: hypothetical protein ISP71_06875 [Flavobacteriales bacterium]|nr:hypothetical protein [Flavobacteriales bacterium]
MKTRIYTPIAPIVIVGGQISRVNPVFLLIIFLLFFSSCKKDPIPDTSGDQYLYCYIDDELFEADFSYQPSSGKGGGGYISGIGFRNIRDKDTIAGLEEWEHPYQTLEIDVASVYPYEVGGGLYIQLKDVYNHTDFQMVQGYCQPRPYPIQYAELDTNFAFYDVSGDYKNTCFYFCTSNIYSGWVRLTKLINTKELVHIEGEFELTLHFSQVRGSGAPFANPPQSVTLTGGRFYKKYIKPINF